MSIKNSLFGERGRVADAHVRRRRSSSSKKERERERERERELDCSPARSVWEWDSG